VKKTNLRSTIYRQTIQTNKTKERHKLKPFKASGKGTENRTTD
jgi:hypothetical protein